MAHITLENHLPGVTGLLEFRKDTAEPLRELTQILLRGASTLSEAEREMIATMVSYRNECVFCCTSHTAAADAYLGENDTLDAIKNNLQTAPLSDKMKALLTIAGQVQENGKNVTTEAIEKAKSLGASDMELHDTVMIAALFSFYNRYVDGLGTFAPSNPTYYKEMGERLRDNGYYRATNGYEHLKKYNLPTL
ncbi:MAG: hypothetical protein RLZZ292_451 [Bacteroidota bacterium]|jgi:uncharacterized peroxidase-related enzyme